MSITMSKAMFKAAVQGLSMVVAKKPVRAVFGCVRITANDGRVKMAATDLEQWVEYRNDSVETVGENDFLFGLAELKELLRLPGDGKLQFDAKPGSVTVKIGELVKEYAAPGVNEFPEAPTVNTSPLAVGPEFFQKLRLAAPMTSKDKVNPTTNCISIRNGQIAVTNRRELLVLNYELGVETPILLPIPKILSLLDTTGTLAVKGDQVRLQSGMWTTIIKQAPGTFPNYEQIVPKPSTLTTQFSIGDQDRATLLNTLGKLKINDPHEPVVLYGSTAGVFAVAGLTNSTVIRLQESKFQAEKPELPLFYTLSKPYLLDVLRSGFTRLRSADGLVLAAQGGPHAGYLIVMSLSARFKADEIRQVIEKSIPHHEFKPEDKTMSNEAKVAIPSESKSAADFKVVDPSVAADAFANLNASLDKLHVALYTLNTCVNDVCRQVRETQRNVKQRDRSFRDLQTTIERFKKVANF